MRAATAALFALIASLPASVLAGQPADAAGLSADRIGAGPHPLDGTIWDVGAAERIDAETLARRLARADIAILGEIHDNAAQHLAQAWLIGRLRPAGIAFEMIPQAQEDAIAAHLRAGGGAGEIGTLIGWDESGWPDWAIYRPIFDAWTSETYTGGGLAREVLMEAGTAGAAALSPDPRFVPMLSQALDPATQAVLEDEMVAAHCDKLPREAAPGMVQIQRLRDASFAAATLRAHAATQVAASRAAVTGAGRTTVLITGNGHGRFDRGVPAYLAAVAPELEVASVGLIETRAGTEAVTGYDLPYDYAWFTAPAERPDPCDSFR